MPCSDGNYRDLGEVTTREIHVDNPKDKQKIKELQKKLECLEGALCALSSELERRGIVEDVLSKASKSGFIDIMTWWGHHKQDDRSRLAADIHKRYSIDEIAIIAQIAK